LAKNEPLINIPDGEYDLAMQVALEYLRCQSPADSPAKLGGRIRPSTLCSHGLNPRDHTVTLANWRGDHSSQVRRHQNKDDGDNHVRHPDRYFSSHNKYVCKSSCSLKLTEADGRRISLRTWLLRRTFFAILEVVKYTKLNFNEGRRLAKHSLCWSTILPKENESCVLR